MNINAMFWHRAKVYLTYIYKVPMVVDYCTKKEQNQPILFCYIATNIKFKKNIGVITQIWHTAKLYFICSGNTWYLISVPNINKINLLFSEISQKIHKMYEKWP